MDELLLTKYLLKETTDEEAMEVRGWIARHPDNAKRYAAMARIWRASSQLGAVPPVDTDAAWDRHVRLRDARAGRPVVRMGRLRWGGYAALALLIPLAVLLVRYFNASGPERVTYAAASAARTDTLVDGSIIRLNRYAVLQYAHGGAGGQRTATLEEGEVFFEVRRDPAKPFVVRAGQVTVTVLGTSFRVKRTGGLAEIIVESGRVRVDGLGRQVELTPGQQVTIDTKEKRFEEGITFTNTPLWRIAEVLNETYGVSIHIENDAIRDLPMSTTFVHGDLDGILYVISETLKIKVERRGDKISLK